MASCKIQESKRKARRSISCMLLENAEPNFSHSILDWTISSLKIYGGR